jgi:hypothetical protein
MDPSATYKAMYDAYYSDHDYDAVIEHADNLKAWLDKGGFPPCNITREVAYMLIRDFRGLAVVNGGVA